MIKNFLLLFLCLFFSTLNAQDKEVYFTSGGEVILSWADAQNNGEEGGVVTRLSAFFHLQSLANYDFHRSAGIFSGISIRNIGFIYDDPINSEVRTKFRTYNFGIPIGLKFGDLDNRFVYVGYELEIPFNYKQKTFINESKEDKFNVWFSDRTPTLMHSAFVGINGISGMSIKFKYYLTNFFNEDFTLIEDGVTTQPFQNFEANVFYISLSFDLFKNTKFYYSSKIE